MPHVAKRASKLLLFATALVAASATVLTHRDFLDQSLVWLPSGVAVAGLWLLGYRAFWIVALVTVGWRLWLGSSLQLALPAAVGSSGEALLGAWLLRRLKVDRGLERLRDVLAIYLVATLAPAASILASWLARMLVTQPGQPFQSGWDGWWRMNAIGILLAVPLALAWSKPAPEPAGSRLAGKAAAWSAVAVAVVAGVSWLLEPGTSALLMLASLPLVALAAALHIGNRGTTATALVGALAVAMTTGYGMGPLLAVGLPDRHDVAQIILVALAAVPMLFGVVLAERDADASRWLEDEVVAKTLLRILPDVTYRFDASGTILDAVAPPGAPQPIPVQELIGRRIHDIPNVTLRARLLEQLRRAQRRLPTETVEYPLLTDRGEVHREARFVALPNGEVLAVARDITERTRAVRQLKLQARILEMIATARRRQEVFAELVDGVEKLIPGSRCSILLRHGDRLTVAAAPSLPDEYNAIVDGIEIGQNQGACGTSAFTNEIVICPDLSTDPRWQDYRDLASRFGLGACWSVPVRSARDSVLGTFAIYHEGPRQPTPHEIGLVKQAAVLAGLTLDRERREGLLASIQQSVSEGLYRAIPGEGFVYVNESFARLFGYDSAVALQQQWPNGQPGNHRDSLQRLIGETTSGRNREVLLHRRDGETFWALVSTNVSFHDDDAELICDGTITDITSHRALEDQLRQSQKMEAVGQLAGGVAHDFNNLLTAITGFAESVHNDLPDESPLRRDVAQIIEAGRRAAGLTRQLLAFGRRQVLSPRVFELPAVVEEIGGMLRRLISEHIELVHRPSTCPVRARVDRGQLEQVLLNLVINARDAMPHGGRITIATSTRKIEPAAAAPQPDLLPGLYAVLEVTDTGAGMPADVQARAFDPFFTTKEPGQGTGLGLSTVYGIVKQSGGSVSIDSHPGRGTTVSVCLPFANEMPTGDKNVIVPRMPRRRSTILVVEDEPFVLELAERALRKAGHEVISAKDGAGALAAFAEHGERIRLVVTDIVMPVMGGRELVRELRILRPALPVLFMSGYAEEVVELNDGDQQTAFLHKPFNASDLLAKVDGLLTGLPVRDRQGSPHTEASQLGTDGPEA